MENLLVTNVQQFVSIMIVGVGLSLLMEWISRKFGVNGGAAKALTLLLSLAVGSIYVWIKDTAYFQTIVLVLTTASTVYALILKK